jgi:hypothetical protein
MEKCVTVVTLFRQQNMQDAFLILFVEPRPMQFSCHQQCLALLRYFRRLVTAVTPFFGGSVKKTDSTILKVSGKFTDYRGRTWILACSA